MGKTGVKLKRKANSRYHSKVKQKRVNKQTGHVHANMVTEPAIREKWTKSKTLLENLKNTDLKEMFGKKLPTHIPDGAINPKKVNEKYWGICKRLIEMFGDDHMKMFRCHKVNIYQWSAGECKRKIDQYNAGLTSDFGPLAGHDRQEASKPVEGRLWKGREKFPRAELTKQEKRELKKKAEAKAEGAFNVAAQYVIDKEE